MRFGSMAAPSRRSADGYGSSSPESDSTMTFGDPGTPRAPGGPQPVILLDAGVLPELARKAAASRLPPPA
jgi:hypothetical protein